MYASYGLMKVGTTDSIAKFLEAFNPYGTIYHANFFLRKIKKLQEDQKTSGARPKGNNPRWFLKIVMKLNESYREAVDLHTQRNPGGPLPRAIRMKQLSSGWLIEFDKGPTLVSLLIPHGSDAIPSVLIKGKKETIEYIMGGFKGSCNWVRQGETVSEKPVCVLPSIRDIRVPLGELLDFLDKYR